MLDLKAQRCVWRCGELPQSPGFVTQPVLSLLFTGVPQPYCALGCGPCARVDWLRGRVGADSVPRQTLDRGGRGWLRSRRRIGGPWGWRPMGELTQEKRGEGPGGEIPWYRLLND